MKKIYLLLLVMISLFSCENTGSQDLEVTPSHTLTNENFVEVEISEEEVQVDEATPVSEVALVEERVDMDALYRTHAVNELGQIMVVMYHGLADKPGSYATTRALFIEDLERLYQEGYRTISMTDLVNNKISTPLGMTPVVLTFDDGLKSHFIYDEAGGISKDSVVSILDDFAKTHHGFGTNAIFYLYGENPFGERAKLKGKLQYLIEKGYEIGNHTYGHDDLSKLAGHEIQASLGKMEAFIDENLDDHNMVHLSLPYGKKPSENLKKFLFEGSHKEATYRIVSSVNVGWNPIKSPADKRFDRKSMNRITVGDHDFELNYWLDYFLENPSKRFVSDGDENKIVVPEGGSETLNQTYMDRVIIYSLEDKKEE